ncbi:hypothetical protein [uncultured Flavobacterium sp.]|uniref:hypothetical protein n=1 Tax=uncultured Flavobacterium sp. TaxID=165435 RepID=UPI0025D9FBCC|nr:hypothetical protein [uncultured Flavobacterium sp.]
MRNFKIITFITLLLISCGSNDEQVESTYLDKDLKSKIDLYIDDSVDIFTEELETEGGFFMWKNYLDYLGLGDVGFKERIHNSWNKAFDNKTLELYVNGELAKKHSTSKFKIDKNFSVIDNYSIILLFPFLQIVFEDLLQWLLVLFVIDFIIIPYVAKQTIRKEYKTNSFWSSLAMNIVSNVERKNRIDARVKNLRKVFNRIALVVLFIFTFFYFDFNDSLNEILKTQIKKDMMKNFKFETNDLTH